MQITKRRLKEIIKEEMEHLAETGDINAITESEKMAFQIILEKLSSEQLEEMGLARVTNRKVVSEKLNKIPEDIQALAQKQGLAAAKRALRKKLKAELDENPSLRASEKASRLDSMMRSATASLKRITGEK